MAKKELDVFSEPGLTFVVEEDHVIMYAGKSFVNAGNAIKGGNKIIVWRNGCWMGEVDFMGNWLMRTLHNRT